MMITEKPDELKQIYDAIMHIANKRVNCVGIEQGGARVPLVPMHELSLFNQRDFSWLAYESHLVINAALLWLEQQDGYEEMIEKYRKIGKELKE